MKSTSTSHLDDRFRFLIEHISAGVIYQDSHGRVMDANRAAENYLGLTLEQMRGHTLLEMPWQASREDGSELPLEDYPQSIVLKTGEPVLGTVIRIHDPASNSRRWLKVDAGPVSTLEEAGAFEVWVTLEEIRKDTQKRADEDDSSFSTIIALKEFMDWTPDAMIVSNPEGHILLANSQIEAIFGFTQDELLRLGVEDLVPHSVRSRHQGHRATYLQESQVQSIKVNREVSAIRKDGSEFPIEIHFSTHTLDGETVVLSTIHDITIRRRAEEELRNNQQLLQESQDIARIQSWTADFKNSIIIVNQRPNPEFGMPPGNYRLTDMAKIIHPDDREYVQSMWALAAANVPLDLEYRILLKDEIRWIHVKTKVTPDENNLPGPTLGFTQDVTERRLAEELTHTQRDLARMISTITSEEEAWPQCLAAALRISGMDSGGIYLIDEINQSLDLVYHQGLGERFIQSVSRYSMDQPNVQMVLAGVKFFFSEAEVIQQENQREEGLRSLAVIPIIDHGHVLGCINLASHSLREMPASARLAIETIASEVGRIIVHMRTEASLHENEEKYRSLINSQDSAISTIDRDGIFHYINQIGAAPFGGDPQLIIGKKISDVFPPHIAAWQMEQIRKVLASQQGLVEEYKSIVAGQVRWRRVSIQPIHDASGQVHLAMVNSLDITDRKNTEEALLKNEALLAEAQRIGHIGHWEWVSPGGEIYCSDEVLNILGLPTKENVIEQKEFRTMILTEDMVRLQEWDQKAFASRSDLDYEFRIQLNDGSIRWVKQLARVTYGEDGGPVRMLGTLQDITERKSVENALITGEKKLRSMINSQTHFLLRIDMEGKYTYWNPKFEQEFGWCHDNDLLNANAMDTILPYHQARVLEVVQKCIAQPAQVFSVEIDKPARDGGVRTTLWEFTCITDEYNRPVEIQCMGVEITERKKAEAAQRESEENYRLLFETMVQGVVFQDADGRISHANPAAQEILGLTLAQMQGRTSSDPCWRTIREDNSEFSGEAHPAMRALKTGEPVHNVVMGVYNLNFNAYRWININAIPRFKPGEEKPYQVYTTFEDITRQKNATELLEKSQASLELAQSAARLGSWELDPVTGTGLTWSREMFNLFQLEPAHGVPPLPEFMEMVHPDDRQSLLDAQSRAIELNTYVAIEYRATPRNGSLHYFQATILPLKDIHGNLMYMSGTVLDITTLKQAYELLRESESKYRLLAENILDVIWILDIKSSRFLYVSPSIFQLRGYTVEEVMGQEFLQTLTPASAQMVTEIMFARIEEAQNGILKAYVDEIEQTCKDGSTIWTEATTKIYINPGSKKMEVYGVSRNITERKKAEAAMRQIEKRNTALIEHAPDGIALVDSNGVFIFASPSAYRMFGYKRDELIGTVSREKVHPDDLHVLDGVRSMLLSEPDKPATFEYRFQHKDGSYRWIESIYTNMFNEPSIGGVVINFKDVTERKLAESALRRSEERFHSLFENSPIAVWEEDFSQAREEFDRLRLAGVTDFRKYWREHPAELNALPGLVKILEINQASVTMLGAEDKQQVIRDLPHYFTEESMKVFEDEMVSLAEGQTDFRGEVPLKNIRGERVILDLILNVQPGYEASLSRVLVSFQDITERRQAEELTRQQSEQIRLLYEASQKLNRSLDLKDIYQTISDFMSVIAPNDTMFISAFDPKTQLITCRAFHLDGKWLDVSDFPAILLEEEGRGTQSQVIRSGQPMLISDFEKYMKEVKTSYIIDSETEAVSDEEVPEEEVTRSALIIPLKSGGAVTGVLQIASYEPDAYNENQLHLLEALALHIASAEQNALLYAQVQNELNERKAAEEALRRSEALLTEAQRIGRMGYMAWVAPEPTLVCSAEIYHILELAEESVITQETLASMMSINDRDTLHQMDMEAFSHHSNLDYEYQVRLESGRIRWLHQMGKITYGEDDQPIRMMAILQDITDRKLIEEALYDSETRAQAMLNAIPDMMFRLNREGVFLDYKADIHDLYTQPEILLISQKHRDVLPPDLADLIEQKTQAALETGKLQTFEYPLTIPGQGPQDYEARMTPSGRNEVTAIVRNITERKRAEEALRETQSRVLLSLKGANAGMWDWKVQTGETVFNERWAEMIGYTLAELEPISIQTWADLCHPDDLKTSDEMLKRHFAGETDFYECEARMKHKDGSWVWVIDRGSVMEWDADRKPVRMFGTHLDITERKQAEEEIQQRSEDLALINTLNDAANRGEDIHAIAQLFTYEMRRLFSGQDAAFYLLSQDGKYFELYSTTVSQKLREQVERLIGTSLPKVRIPLDESDFLRDILYTPQGTLLNTPEGIQKWILEFTKTIFLPRIARNAIQSAVPRIYKMLKIRSVINMPLISSDHTIGLMDISSSGDLTKKEMERILNIARQMTAVIQRKRAEHNVQVQLQRITALSEIDRAISSSLDLHLSLEVLLTEVIGQLKVDAASILLLNTANQTLEYAAGKGFHSTAIRQSRVKLGEGLPGRAGHTRKTLHVSDWREADIKIIRTTLFRDEGFVEYFGVPLIAKGMLKGVMEIFHRSHLELDEEWENYLETLGGQAAIAIDNAQLFEGMQQSNQDLITAYDATIAGWSRAMDLRDKETEGHTQRVTEITVHLAERMGVTPSEMLHIRRGALLHDIGKLGVPDSILLKPGKLTEEEWVIMREHPKFAFEMLLPITYLRPALDIPYSHHERWDGTGYPRGLKGEQIPLAARIFAIVDVWDALRSDRPYRESWSIQKVKEHILKQSGSHFDPQVVQAFTDLLDEMPDLFSQHRAT